MRWRWNWKPVIRASPVVLGRGFKTGSSKTVGRRDGQGQVEMPSYGNSPLRCILVVLIILTAIYWGAANYEKEFYGKPNEHERGLCIYRPRPWAFQSAYQTRGATLQIWPHRPLQEGRPRRFFCSARVQPRPPTL